MRKVLSLGVLALALQGCMISGPLALLPPTAKYLLWNSDDSAQEPSTEAISVDDLLKNVRGFTSEQKKPDNIRISYSDYTLSDERLAELARFKNDTLEVVCGPYEYGTPLEAATMALRTCSEIKAQLVQRGLKPNMRFSPSAPKGEASVTPISVIEASDA